MPRQVGTLMMDTKELWRAAADIAEKPAGLACLIGCHLVIVCASLVLIAQLLNAPAFHIFFDQARLPGAIAVVAAFALVSLLFVFARFSVGYFIGFYLYSMIVGYLWINRFSDLNYDHGLSGLSAAASALAFLLPALLITSPIPQAYVLSRRSFELILTLILLAALATIAGGAIYNFKFVAVQNIYEIRDKLEFPTATTYAMAMTSSVLLPFAFAGFVERRNFWRAGAVLFLALLFYPITLSKLTLFTPAWLVATAVLARLFRARTSVILSLLLPLLAGILITAFKAWPMYLFVVNFRMMAVPSVAMDVYNHYFSDHDLTYFCQIRFLKPFMACPYQDQLSVVLEKVYRLGNFNASLFATEGTASVGPLLAPLSALVCGLVIALGNRVSAGLPPAFVLTSSAVLPQILLNVPLTTTLVTHGAAALFLLWYVTPRPMFEEKILLHGQAKRPPGGDSRP
jgi:hypothetical protein